MSEITVYNGKRYIRCSRCGDDQRLHEEGCRNCRYVIDQGLCWICIISADPRVMPQVVSFGVDQGDERD